MKDIDDVDYLMGDFLKPLISWLQADPDNIHHLPEDEVDFLRKALKDAEPPRETPQVYIVTVLAESDMMMGYRTRFIRAKNEDEAIGCALRSFDRDDSSKRYHTPAALHINRNTMAQIGVRADLSFMEVPDDATQDS
jgi:hypothetical protein